MRVLRPILIAALVLSCTEATTSPPVQHVVSITPAGNGAGMVTSAPSGISCGADCSESYQDGTSVTLTAAPAIGSTFTGWSGAGCSGTGTCGVNVAAATSVTATFALVQHPLSVSMTGNGEGSVASTSAGINCGADCEQAYDHGTSVTLVATAAANSSFDGWSGGGCSGDDDCTVSMTAAATVTATFSVRRHQLVIFKNGTGGGDVSSNPVGIDCGPDCSDIYDHGTSVTLTAVPAAGSTFAGWSGGGCSGTGTCTVTIAQAMSVTATFNVTLHALTVVRAGTGTGTVTSNPAGLNCGADCSELYVYGTGVTLTAAAAVGSTFAGWSGAGACSGTGTCLVNVTAAASVTATFTLTQHTLTVTRAGTGVGTVTSSPAGINCGVDCTQTYNYGTVVTLTAAATTGSSFAGWSGGGCAGTGTCIVTVTAATAVTATFNVNQHTLTVARAGTGAGTVTSSPAGINCGVDCAQAYNQGTSVTLTAAATAGSTFAGWSGGGCAGTGTCSVTVTAAVTVTATFNDATPPTLSSSHPANGGTGVAQNTTIRLTFSEPMNHAATQAAFSLTAPVGATGTFSWEGNTLIFDPTSNFQCPDPALNVQWTLSTGARDVAGNAIAVPAAGSFRIVRCFQEFFTGEGLRDGYVTNTGAVNSALANILVGDFANNGFARGFVSFDFSSLPSNAVITQAFAQIRGSARGSPSQLGDLLMESVLYGTTLDASDFSLTAIGAASTGDFAAGSPGLAFWFLTDQMIDGWTNRATRGTRLQLRIRFPIDFFINATADGYDFLSTEGGGASNAPQLSVSYRIP